MANDEIKVLRMVGNLKRKQKILKIDRVFSKKVLPIAKLFNAMGYGFNIRDRRLRKRMLGI